VAVCPACGEENLERAKFCLECGAALAVAAAAVQERKIVTVLFCDVVGFTAASETADPEDVRARMDAYYRAVRPVIESFGGSVEKFIGDAVMAVFGVPLAHEDDAERAVRAGLGIVEAIEELNRLDPALDLAVRLGINTGEVLVNLGASGIEGEVLGDAVNTASRVQGVAPVNGLAVSVHTFRATERVFEWERLEAAAVKGKSEPLALWRPVKARARLGSDVVRTQTTPLVGRELERSLLIGTFERADQQSSCQLVSIVGEPGVGKSRLCAELLDHVAQRPGLVRWRQGRCLPYGEGILFWALGEIVKAECGILESDTPAQAAAKLDQAVAEDVADRAWLLTRLAPLVGAPAEAVGQEESFAAWRLLCENLAAERTTVLVFEDLHWADPSMLAFLEHLADWAEGVPLLLVCTARPELYEQHPTFGAHARNAQRINLAPLTDAETAQLVLALLERTVLPPETQQVLLERAGGNPLYAEEFVRLLTDRGAEHIEVPESVQALIAARLDTLPADRKSLLQDASVLGKVFWSGALAEMGGHEPAAVEQALHELARKELVRPARTSSVESEHEYGFWHVLVRDVCYAQIPRAARAARHEAAAAWIEAKSGGRAEDVADVLAHHYQAALELSRAAGIDAELQELQTQAIHYLALAGARALSLDVGQAERQLAGALDLCPADDPVRASLLEGWSHAAQQQGRLLEAKEALEQALDLYRKKHEPVSGGRVLTRLGLVLHRLGDPRSEEAFDDAVEILEQQPAGPELVDALAYRAGRFTLTNRYAQGVAAAGTALSLAEALGLPEPAFALMWRGSARCSSGQAEGVGDVRRALELALEQGLGRETAVIYGHAVWVAWAYEGPRAALRIENEEIAFCERRGITELALQSRATRLSLLAELGETAEPLAEAGLLADRLEAAGDIAYLGPRALQVRLLAEHGAPDSGPALDNLLAASRDLRPGPVSALAAAAQLLLAQQRPEQARAVVLEVDQLVADQGELASELPSLVRVALALGDQQIAQRLVDRAEPLNPSSDHAIASSRAQLAEAGGDVAGAVERYSDASVRWETFGNVPERAYALLGKGRCLRALDSSMAEEPLCVAKELFATMGYKPALAKTEALLGDAEAAAVEHQVRGRTNGP
jgi:class 3 adenylate cyclase/tetratricopeptide (TPR) repeat protein